MGSSPMVGICGTVADKSICFENKSIRVKVRFVPNLYIYIRSFCFEKVPSSSGRTESFQGLNKGSIPLGTTKQISLIFCKVNNKSI
jgi:hypothetical protein